MKKLTQIAIVGGAILTAAILSTATFAGDWGYEYLDKKAGKLNETIHTSTSDNTAVAFICSGTQLRASIATENNSAGMVLEKWSKDRTRMSKKVTLSVNGEAVDTSTWRISRKYNIYTTLKRPITVQLYKAAMNGEAVSFQREGKEAISITFPAPDDVFNEFGRDCGVGDNF